MIIKLEINKQIDETHNDGTQTHNLNQNTYNIETENENEKQDDSIIEINRKKK